MSQKILILGGTQFIGRNLVERLLQLSHFEITLFNRQISQSGIFPEVQKIKGDRETSAIEQIRHQHWDFVIDLSCYYPESLIQTLNQLDPTVTQYILISSCSAYDHEHDFSHLRNEQSTILSCSKQEIRDRTPMSYGHRKAECELILQRSKFRHSIFRPALVYGKYDPTDRFYYWLYQVKVNDPVLLPDHGQRVFSITYVDDLIACIILSLEKQVQNQVFNVISTPKASIQFIVQTAIQILKTSINLKNASPALLKTHNIDQWTDMPLWIDADHFTYSNQKMKDHFLIEPTPLSQRMKTTIAYYNSMHWPIPRYGMNEQKRQSLLNEII